MFGWSFPVGKIFGVEVRLHTFFVFLLFLAMVWASFLEVTLMRGAVLWLLLLSAVAVREVARGLGAAWFGMQIRSVLLLPTGGILTYASPHDVARAGETKVGRWMALLGPIANIVCGLTLAGLMLTIAPAVNLIGMRWVTPMHLLRSLVWLNLLLAAINFLPAWPLDGSHFLEREGSPRARGNAGASARPRRVRALTSVGPAIAIGLILIGALLVNWWVIMAGLTILLGAQIERQGVVLEPAADLVKVRDVMLTEYSILSASATLEDAIEQARHTLQDVFPVVRAGNMVGSVARQSILDALDRTGDGYVQGIMTRTFETAAPGDSLVATLGRVSGASGASSQMVPVLEGERIVGIITPQNLQRSMGLVARKLRAGGTKASASDAENGR